MACIKRTGGLKQFRESDNVAPLTEEEKRKIEDGYRRAREREEASKAFEPRRDIKEINLHDKKRTQEFEENKDTIEPNFERRNDIKEINLHEKKKLSYKIEKFFDKIINFLEGKD